MKKPIDDSFRETITSSDLPAVIQDIGEICIDSLLDDGVLKDVPILGSVLAIGKTFGTVRDYYLTKKLMSFLGELSSLPDKEREKLIVKLEADSKYKEAIGAKIIDLLSRIDDERKPKLIAKAFKLYLAGKIDYTELSRVNYSIDRFQLCDRDEFIVFAKGKDDNRLTDGKASTANFINSGLGYAASGYGAGGVHPTETARILSMVLES